jgi:hypothetical protein
MHKLPVLHVEFSVREPALAVSAGSPIEVEKTLIEAEVLTWTPALCDELYTHAKTKSPTPTQLIGWLRLKAIALAKSMIAKGYIAQYAHATSQHLDQDGKTLHFCFAINAEAVGNGRIQFETPFVEELATAFLGVPSILVRQTFPTEPAESTVMTCGAADVDLSPLGDSPSIPLELEIVAGSHTCTQTLQLSTAEISSQTNMFPINERATPGGRLDCAFAIVEAMIRQSILDADGRVDNLQMLDYSQSAKSPGIRAICHVSGSSNDLPALVFNEMCASHLALAA